MRVKNKIDRFNLMLKILKYIDIDQTTKKQIEKEMKQKLKFHTEYICENGIDMPEILNWKWEC